jgi:hypothetical protein
MWLHVQRDKLGIKGEFNSVHQGKNGTNAQKNAKNW